MIMTGRSHVQGGGSKHRDVRLRPGGTWLNLNVECVGHNVIIYSMRAFIVMSLR